MEIQLIRNATLKIKFAGKQLLVDPMLSPAQTFPPFVKGLEKNPTCDLTISIESILNQLDAVLVTHTHPDHFDPASRDLLPKNIPLFCTPADKEFVLFQDFQNRQVVEHKVSWEGISIERIEGQHGSGPVLQYMGKMSGFILKHKQEPSLYIIGDSILTDEIMKTISAQQPEVIVCNAGGGIIPGFENYPVMFDEKQTIDLVEKAPRSTVLAVHLEAIDFCKVSRQSLKRNADLHGIPYSRLIIPKDGELMTF